MRSSIMDTDELPVFAPAVSTVGPPTRPPALDRRAVRDARRKARQVRRFYALAGLAVLAAFLALTVFVVDMVR